MCAVCTPIGLSGGRLEALLDSHSQTSWDKVCKSASLRVSHSRRYKYNINISAEGPTLPPWVWCSQYSADSAATLTNVWTHPWQPDVKQISGKTFQRDPPFYQLWWMKTDLLWTIKLNTSGELTKSIFIMTGGYIRNYHTLSTSECKSLKASSHVI